MIGMKHSFKQGDTVFCEYTNWRGITTNRGFIFLESVYASNEYHKEEQVLHIGYDISKCEIRTFADKDVRNVEIAKPYSKRIVSYRTNWYMVNEDGSVKFNHQAPFKDYGIKPTTMKDYYGLQRRWKDMKWEKETLYYINNEYVGRVKINVKGQIRRSAFAYARQ